jgi:competence ComEA-like helix-hairpin-helix protein
MNSRQRGAFWLLAALAAGHLADRFHLPFVRSVRTGNAAVPSPSVSIPTDGTSAAAPAANPSTGIDTTGLATSVAVAPGAPADSGSASLPSVVRHARATAPDVDPSAPLHINRASASDLQRLPGVGPVLAGRIVAQRATHGPFRNLADLAAVRGLGPKTCARLAPLLRFD